MSSYRNEEVAEIVFTGLRDAIVNKLSEIEKEHKVDIVDLVNVITQVSTLMQASLVTSSIPSESHEEIKEKLIAAYKESFVARFGDIKEDTQ